jgi:hypothetical protein
MATKRKEPAPAKVRVAILQFTKDGKPIGPRILGPPIANDIRFIWRGRVFIRANWTHNGRPIGPLIRVPKGANDAKLIL